MRTQKHAGRSLSIQCVSRYASADGIYLRLLARKKGERISLSLPREGFRSSSYSSRRPVCFFEFLLYAAPIALPCWKHSRQNTGRPCVGRKGTVVSFPHFEQFVFVSERIGDP